MVADFNCEYCGGTGERYWHSDNCRNEDCPLNGGIDSCSGQLELCPCVRYVPGRLMDKMIRAHEEEDAMMKDAMMKAAGMNTATIQGALKQMEGLADCYPFNTTVIGAIEGLRVKLGYLVERLGEHSRLLNLTNQQLLGAGLGPEEKVPPRSERHWDEGLCGEIMAQLDRLANAIELDLAYHVDLIGSRVEFQRARLFDADASPSTPPTGSKIGLAGR